MPQGFPISPRVKEVLDKNGFTFMRHTKNSRLVFRHIETGQMVTIPGAKRLYEVPRTEKNCIHGIKKLLAAAGVTMKE